jgi:hypothetical protein
MMTASAAVTSSHRAAVIVRTAPVSVVIVPA